MSGFQDLATLSGIPGLEPAVGALFKFYQSVEKIKVYQAQCVKLRARCTDLLLALRDNGAKMVGTEYMKAVDEAEITMERVSRKVHTWSTWGKPKALLYQSEIKQGLDDLNKDLDHCATRFNIVSQMDIVHRQREMGMVLTGNHAEIQDKLQQLLDRTQDIQKIVRQPERSITSDMLSIQEAIHADVAGPEQQHSLQERLLKIHRQTELLPPMIDLTGEVRRVEEHPVNISGGYSDVYLGEWLGDEKVALKLTRGINQTPKAQKRFINEVAIWRQLQHKNVARLYGVATLGNHIYAVSPWMEHRDALSYVENNPGADRLKLLCEVATGLDFLHKHGVVHGDLRGANILISDSEVACITDFGLSVILEEEVESTSSSATIDNHGNSRWMAPELINPELIGLQVVKPGPATDVWSYGMLCLEVLTGQRPFHNRTRAPAVISDLISGVRPTRPPAEVTRRGLSDALWDLMQKCWHQNPNLRPSMSDILPKMKALQAARAGPFSSLKTPSPGLPPKRPFDYSRSPSSSNVLGNSSPLRTSPIPIPIQSNNMAESPSSITPPTGSQTVFFPPSGSSRSSRTRPSTGGSNASSTGNYLQTSPRIMGLTPQPSPRAPISNHGKSVSLDAARSQEKHHDKSVRPSTAGAAQETTPRLPHIGEFHDEAGGEGLDDFLTYLQAGFSDSNVIPTVQLQRTSTPEPGVASSLPSSFVAPVGHRPSRLELDVAPSEDYGNYSMSSGPSPTSSANGDPPRERQMYIKYGPDGLVEAATLPGLVERLIYDSTDFRKDMQFRETFLVSYQAFTDAEDVFTLLLERFQAVSAPDHTPEQRASVRYSVLTVLDLWLHSHHVEVKDAPLLDRMREFAMSIQRSSPAPTLGASAQRLAELIDSTEATLVSSPVPPLTPSSSSLSLKSAARPSEISPQGLALALTMLERDRYRKIIHSDFIGWIKGIHKSNGISSFITENNRLSYWVQKSILKPDEQSQRSENLKYFLCVAEECRRLRNFSSTCALFAGLASSSITGLKRTSTLDKSCGKIFAEAEKLMSPDKNFRAYRKALNASPEPCVPWLRVHLHDVKVIHDSHRTFIKQDGYTDVINFDLYHRVHERIRHILSYQDPPPTQVDNDPYMEIQGFISGQLRSLVVDESLRNWLQERGSKLAREEKADYVSHRQELAAAGFIRPN